MKDPLSLDIRAINELRDEDVVGRGGARGWNYFWVLVQYLNFLAADFLGMGETPQKEDLDFWTKLGSTLHPVRTYTCHLPKAVPYIRTPRITLSLRHEGIRQRLLRKIELISTSMA